MNWIQKNEKKILLEFYLKLNYNKEANPSDMNPDKKVFELMQQFDDDLSKCRPVQFYFYFPDEGAAVIMSDRLESMSFETEVSPAAIGEKWLCLATRNMVPDSDIIEGLRAIFTNTCSKLGGEYDGWETELIM